MSSHPQTLDDRIASLPQELQDEILCFFCLAQAESIESVTVRKSDYRPPYFLQLTRQTRAIAAPSYYNCTAFSFMDDGNIKSPMELWLSSLPSAHRSSVKTLDIIIPCGEPFSTANIVSRAQHLREVLHDMEFLGGEGRSTMSYLYSGRKLILKLRSSR